MLIQEVDYGWDNEPGVLGCNHFMTMGNKCSNQAVVWMLRIDDSEGHYCLDHFLKRANVWNIARALLLTVHGWPLDSKRDDP